VKEGAMVTEAAVKSAIESEGALGFTSHEVVELAKPKSAWVIPTGYG